VIYIKRINHNVETPFSQSAPLFMVVQPLLTLTMSDLRDSAIVPKVNVHSVRLVVHSTFTCR